MNAPPSPADDVSPAAFRRPGIRGVAAAALGGLVSAAAGLGVAEVVAGLSSSLRSPVLDVGDRVVDRVPVWAKELAIDWFGTNDKIALLVGIAAILAIYAAVVGILALRRDPRFGYAGIALFGLLGSLASLGDRTGASLTAVLPSVVGSVVAAAALWWLGRTRPVLGDIAPRLGLRHPSERRRFLAQTGVLAGVAAVFAATGRRLEARFSAADSRAATRLPVPDVPEAAVPAGAQAEGAAPLFTGNDVFYRIDTALTVPQVPVEGWELRVTGMVDQPLRLTFDDLLERQVEEHDITLACVSNTIGGELIGTARWMGVRLDDLLAEAGIDAAADQIVGRSVDGYTCGFPVAALDGRDAMVAFGMNGEPLPLEHGFPARLIVPGIYGYASATKWLTEIELTTFDDFDHYWVPRGYSVRAPIKLQSRIDRPRGLDRIPPGPFVIGGVAWAQTIGIDGVELRIDEGDWQPAELATEVNDTTWRQWSFEWDAVPGRHSVEVRAIDRNGAIQTEERSEPLPNGATGHHTVVVLVDEA
ncbi:MAG: molybdopterin-dependent oxidoreductase [Acidimicrobiales bacterium]